MTASLVLQKRVRDPRAGYFQSLEVLKAAKECGVYTKSSIMLGLGETDDEIIDTMYDLKDAVSSSGNLHPCLAWFCFLCSLVTFWTPGSTTF